MSLPPLRIHNKIYNNSGVGSRPPQRPYENSYHHQQQNYHQHQHHQHQYQQQQIQRHPRQQQLQPQQQQQHAPTSLAPQPKKQHPGWSTDANTSNYDAIFDTEPSSSVRTVRTQNSVNSNNGQSGSNTSKGIRGKKFGYAFIGRESEQYVQEELKNQLTPAIVLPIYGDFNVPSPLTPARLAPRMIVDEYKRAGHFDTTRNQLRASFETSENKEFAEPREALFESLQTYLLTRIKGMTPEARQKMALKPDKLQISELTNWIEESKEAAKIIDDLMQHLRGRVEDDDSLFGSNGTIGKPLENRLYDIVQLEKRRLDQRKNDSDDEEGNSTPLNRESLTPSGSRTPTSLAQETN